METQKSMRQLSTYSGAKEQIRKSLFGKLLTLAVLTGGVTGCVFSMYKAMYDETPPMKAVLFSSAIIVAPFLIAGSRERE